MSDETRKAEDSLPWRKFDEERFRSALIAEDLDACRTELAKVRGMMNAYCTDLGEELNGSKALREKYGAHPDETMAAFVARLAEHAAERERLEAERDALSRKRNELKTMVGNMDRSYIELQADKLATVTRLEARMQALRDAHEANATEGPWMEGAQTEIARNALAADDAARKG